MFHRLNQLDSECVQALVGRTPADTGELDERVERERSTASQAIQRLLQTGFITGERVENSTFF